MTALSNTVRTLNNTMRKNKLITVTIIVLPFANI